MQEIGNSNSVILSEQRTATTTVKLVHLKSQQQRLMNLTLTILIIFKQWNKFRQILQHAKLYLFCYQQLKWKLQKTVYPRDHTKKSTIISIKELYRIFTLRKLLLIPFLTIPYYHGKLITHQSKIKVQHCQFTPRNIRILTNYLSNLKAKSPEPRLNSSQTNINSIRNIIITNNNIPIVTTATFWNSQSSL